MDYFSKLTDEGDLILTSISDDSEVIVIGGDYIKIWDLIQSSEMDSEKYRLAISDKEISFLKPFLNFLYFNKFGFDLSDIKTKKIVLGFKENLSGTFKLFEVYSVNNGNHLVYAQWSPRGKDAYGWPEGCSEEPCE